jgi:hypothetical protein
MGSDKIAAYYADPVKTACDQHSFNKAFTLRAMSIDDSLAWRARRWVRFLARLAIGAVRRVVMPIPAAAPARDDAPAPDRAGAELSLRQR